MLGLALVACSAVSGCADRRDGDASRALGSAIWPSVSLPWTGLRTPEVEQALRTAGISYQFVEAGKLGSAVRLEGLPVSPPLAGLATVLVVRGEWGDLARASRGELAELAEALVLMAVEWEGARTTVRGIHLLLSGRLDDVEKSAQSIARLSKELPARLALSLHLEPQVLAAEAGLDELAKAVDLLVCDVYGQPWSQADVADRWELEAALERARVANGLGRPFLAAIAREGHLFARESGSAVARGIGPQLLESGWLSVTGAFTYEGFHRQLLDLTPRRALDVLGGDDSAVRLEARAEVRLARPTAQHLGALLRSLEREPLERLEGVVWTGGGGEPSAAEVPALRLPAIVSGPLASGIELGVERDVRAGRLGVTLRNGEDPTAWADRDHNFVEVDLDGALFGEVDLGDFARMELARRVEVPGESPMERLRRADRVRLYFVSLEPGEVAASGAIHLRAGSRAWRADARASVLGAAGVVESVLETVPETVPGAAPEAEAEPEPEPERGGG
jgi:hypothetical protein